MSRRRVALTVLAGVLLGFFLGLAAFSLGTETASRAIPQPAPAGAAAATATEIFGQLQANKAPKCQGATSCVVVFIRTLSDTKKSNAKCPCPAVFQMQRALKAAKFRPASSSATGVFGNATRDEIKRFQKAKKLPASGVYGLATHRSLSPYYDQAGRGRLQQVAHSRQVTKYRNAIVHAASVAWSHRSQMAYSQSASRGFLPVLPNFPHATDCSGYATWLFKVSGLADPSGFGYRIVGYTGTLALHGARVSASGRLFPGDLVFYGGGYPFGHVAIVVDGFRRLVSSHGSPGIKVVPFNYRPVSVIRRYF